MKTALLTASYLVGLDPLGSSRHERLERFLMWHRGIGFDDIYVSDNASPRGKTTWFNHLATTLRHQEHLPRGEGENNYPYCWRHVYTMKILIQLGYEKILFLDSDCFIVSQRMTDYIENVQSGWSAFWIPKYNFPSAELQILCKDAFPLFEKYTSIPYQDHVGKLMESDLPFTHVNKDLKADRWGETRTPQELWMDAYFQAPVDLELTYVSK